MSAWDGYGKAYTSLPAIYAELINTAVFKGKRGVDEKNLQQAEYRFVTNNIKGKVVEMQRDGFMKVKKGKKVFYAGIEIQTSIDPTMPLRIMQYDVLAYLRQIETIKEENEKEKRKGMHYLSKIRKEDRILPVITLVLYFGEEAWDHHRELKEMLSSQIKGVNNYRIKVIDVGRIKDLDSYRTSLRLVIRLYQSKDRWEKMEEILQEEGSEIEIEGARFINALLGLGMKIEEDGKEKIDMCKAWEEQKRRGIKEGMALGLKEGKLAIQKTKVAILEELIKRGFGIEEALSIVQVQEEEKGDFLEKLQLA